VLNRTLLREFLPLQPSDWALWAIVFNLPHIVSSFVTLADKEYIKYYGVKFLAALTVIVAIVVITMNIIPMFLSYQHSQYVYACFYAFFATYTMHHILSQQFGIGMMMARIPQSTLYQVMRMCSTMSATSLYMMVFAKNSLQSIHAFGTSAQTLILIISGISIVCASYCAVRLIQQSDRILGRGLILSNVLMLYATWVCMLLGYTVFVILIPRFVHDITAFIIYSAHDHNRNIRVRHNYFYRCLAILPITPLVLCPILAIGLAYSVESFTAMSDKFFNEQGYFLKIGVQVLFIFGLFHYYIEGFVWKKDGIHRHSLKFK